MTDFDITEIDGPHARAKVSVRGNSTDPKTALLLFHGRGASAQNILRLVPDVPPRTIVLAPDANGHQWYPNRFLFDRSENQPDLDSALQVIEKLLEYCTNTYSLSFESVVLAGFSQGACLAADFAARHPHRFKALCIFSGGLIGSDTDITLNKWNGSLEKTPVYIGCDNLDPHIPISRVRKTADIYFGLDAEVKLELYDSLGHSVHPEGIAFLRNCLD